MKKNKLITTAAILLAATTALTACSSDEPVDNTPPTPVNDNGTNDATSEPATDGEKVTLTFSWWGSDGRHEALQAVAALYEEKNPNVTVNVDYGAFTGWDQKMLTMLSGAEEADIMQLNYNWIHSFGKGKNVFYDLNTLESLDLSNWGQVELDSMTLGGELAAVPFGTTGRVQLYNTTLFEENGLEYPTTYDQLIEYGSIIGANNTPNGADNKYVLTNIGEQSTDLFIAQMLYNKTGKIMQTDGTVNYTVDDVKEVLALYTEMENSGAIPTYLQEDPIQNESNPVWTSGYSGSVYEWVSSADKYLDSYKGGNGRDEISVAPYLTYNEGDDVVVYVKPNFGYGISANTKNPEAAAAFLEFLFTDEDAVTTYNSQLGVSTNKVTRSIQEENGVISGSMAVGYDILGEYDQVVLDPYFEDGNVRGKRYEVLEAYRSGAMSLDDAAERYISYQQEELDKLFN